jgi:hypothetical protein
MSPGPKKWLESCVSRFSTICAKNQVLKLKTDKVTVIRVTKSPFLANLPCITLSFGLHDVYERHVGDYYCGVVKKDIPLINFKTCAVENSVYNVSTWMFLWSIMMDRSLVVLWFLFTSVCCVPDCNFEIPVSADPGCDQITNWVTVYAEHTVEVK